MASLKGKTIFMSGGSRGIGLAIALRAARDGANVIIAAKTATPHPTLPGTIHTAAAEIAAAGGQAFPVVCDIREEEQVTRAVAQGAERFGGIDILICNASAIFLAGTAQTPMKRFDLMHQINARGTYLCGQACLPHLLRSNNAQIMALAPPMDFSRVWWGAHLAYTMAKFGMSACIHGWAEEFKDAGIKANALWPRTAIATAAIAMIEDIVSIDKCRKPEIVADAAHTILTNDSPDNTGNFYIDDEVLSAAGVSNFDHYATCPGTLLDGDIFLDSGHDGYGVQAMTPKAR